MEFPLAQVKDPNALQSKDIPLSGKLATTDDGLMIGSDFTVLQNMRYTKTHPQGIQGMTKVNGTALSNPQVRAAHHFRKAQPVESHVVVQAFDSAGANSKIFTNDMAIPNTGNFNPASLHTDAAGSSRGYFASGPNGSLIYCNSAESLIWGGDETRIGEFINYDPGGTFSLDFTDVLNNTMSNAANSAAIRSVISGGVDTSTVLLLHLDGNVTDSGSVPKTATNNNVTFSGSVYKWGESGVFNGTTAYLTTPDSTDFNFSGGTWTLDCWFNTLSLASAQTLYSQITDADNWMRITVETNGSVSLYIKAAGTETKVAGTIDSIITVGNWNQIEVSESSGYYRIFLNGTIMASVNSAIRPADYTGSVYIGARTNGSSVVDYLNGYLDEYRVSTACRHLVNFQVPSAPFTLTVGGGASYFKIGATRPITGIKFYISVPNVASGAIGVNYWDGSEFTPVSSLVDNTNGLQQTGTVTFVDTSAVAKQTVQNSLVLYWYQVSITTSEDTAIYYVTLSDVMQPIIDLWDGSERDITAFELDQGTSYVDYTDNVYNSTFSSSDPTTYCNIGGLRGTSPSSDPTSFPRTCIGSVWECMQDFPSGGSGITQAFEVGFSSQMQAVHFLLGGGNVNTTANTVCYVYYWDGSQWVNVGGLNDGTSTGGISMSTTGIISWNAPSPNLEFMRSLDLQDDTQFYYYRFIFTQTLSANVWIYFASGIPAPQIIYPYKFPIAAMNRVWLCSDQSGQKNKVICSNSQTCDVYNGSDSATFFFGDESEITAACWLYSQYGTTLYNTMVFTKVNETHILVGDGPSNWAQYQVSPAIGCPAPQTLCVVPGESELYGGTTRAIAIWQGNEAVYMFDGKGFMALTNDIADWFEIRKSYSINRAMLSQSRGWYDSLNSEYHWIFASGTSTTLDTEFVYNIPLKKWYQVVRGAGMNLQCGLEVLDLQGNTYNYGFVDAGYMERLENGTTFDGNPIACVIELGDNPFVDLWRTSSVRWLELITVAKMNTTNQITVSNWGDTSEGSPETLTMSPTKSGYRVAMPILSEQTSALNEYVFRRLGFSLSTTNEPYAFEPLALSVKFIPRHERIK